MEEAGEWYLPPVGSHPSSFPSSSSSPPSKRRKDKPKEKIITELAPYLEAKYGLKLANLPPSERWSTPFLPFLEERKEKEREEREEEWGESGEGWGESGEGWGEKGVEVEVEMGRGEEEEVGRARDVWPLAAAHPSLRTNNNNNDNNNKHPSDSFPDSLSELLSFTTKEVPYHLLTHLPPPPTFPPRESGRGGKERKEREKQFSIEVGRWGERVAYNFLSSLSPFPVVWQNEQGDSHLPYDLTFVEEEEGEGERRKRKRGQENGEGSTTHFVEVKTTSVEGKKTFHITPNEINMAMKYGNRYHICLVWCRAPPRLPVVRVVRNVEEAVVNSRALNLFFSLASEDK